MEERSNVTAPVTRLRGRLSTEAQDVSSPQPSTPTKKRTGRLAAKPLLDNIDENAAIPIPNQTRGRKPVAPNTLEAEEKPVTPSRRSTRIKSNTSLTSDTTLALDSPRAKRASRRHSGVGSDTEAPLTPLRQSRRTRRNSDVENLAEVPPNPAIQLNKETIIFPENTSPQKPQRKSKESQKTPPKVPEEVNIPKSAPAVLAEILTLLPKETEIMAVHSETQAPQRKSKTPKKRQDTKESPSTPQNSEKMVLRNCSSNAEKLVNDTTQTAINISKEMLITPQKELEKIEIQKTPQNVPEKTELQTPNFTIRNLAEITDQEVEITIKLIPEDSKGSDKIPKKVERKSMKVIESPQKEQEQLEIQKCPLNVPDNKELHNTTSQNLNPELQVTKEIMEDSDPQKPEGKPLSKGSGKIPKKVERKSIEVLTTPQKEQDFFFRERREIQKTPQNVPEKKELLTYTIQNLETSTLTLDANCLQNDNISNTTAEITKPATQVTIESISVEPESQKPDGKQKCNTSQEIPKTVAEQIHSQILPQNAPEKNELKISTSIVENEAEITDQEVEITIKLIPEDYKGSDKIPKKVERKSMKVIESPQKEQEQLEIQKCPLNVPDNKELHNTTSQNLNPELQVTKEIMEDSDPQKPEGKPLSKGSGKIPKKVERKSIDVLTTPQKEQDFFFRERREIQKTPQNVPEKKELLTSTIQNLETSTLTLDANCLQNDNISNTTAEITKPATQVTIESISVEPESQKPDGKQKSNTSQEIPKTVAEQIHSQILPQNAPEKNELKISTSIVENEAKVPAKVKEKSFHRAIIDAEGPQYKRNNQNLHQMSQKVAAVSKFPAPQIGPEHVQIEIDPHVMLSSQLQSPETIESKDVHSGPLQKILSIEDVKIFPSSQHRPKNTLFYVPPNRKTAKTYNLRSRKTSQEINKNDLNKPKTPTEQEISKQVTIGINPLPAHQANVETQQKISKPVNIKVNPLAAYQANVETQQKISKPVNIKVNPLAAHQANVETLQKISKPVNIKVNPLAAHQANVETQQKISKPVNIKVNPLAAHQANVETQQKISKPVNIKVNPLAAHQANVETLQKISKPVNIKVNPLAAHQTNVETQQKISGPVSVRVDPLATHQANDETQQKISKPVYVTIYPLAGPQTNVKKNNNSLIPFFNPAPKVQSSIFSKPLNPAHDTLEGDKELSVYLEDLPLAMSLNPLDLSDKPKSQEFIINPNLNKSLPILTEQKEKREPAQNRSNRSSKVEKLTNCSVLLKYHFQKESQNPLADSLQNAKSQNPTVASPRKPLPILSDLVMPKQKRMLNICHLPVECKQSNDSWAIVSALLNSTNKALSNGLCRRSSMETASWAKYIGCKVRRLPSSLNETNISNGLIRSTKKSTDTKKEPSSYSPKQPLPLEKSNNNLPIHISLPDPKNEANASNSLRRSTGNLATTIKKEPLSPPRTKSPKYCGETTITTQNGGVMAYCVKKRSSSRESLGGQMNQNYNNVDTNKQNEIEAISYSSETLTVGSETLTVGSDTVPASSVTQFPFAPDSEHCITVYIDEDQSNVDKLLKLSHETSNKIESGDQCVPVMKQDVIVLDIPAATVNERKSRNFNPLSKPKVKTESSCSQKSVEPMDIDESIPENISIEDFSKDDISGVEKQVKGHNKSKLEGVSEKSQKDSTCNENKSTLNLSLVNDEPSKANLTKSPKASKETLESISNVSNVGKIKKTKKTNQSQVTEFKDTPLKLKNTQLVGMQTSTPVTAIKKDASLEKSISASSKKSSHSESSLNDESSDEKNMSKLVIDEAEDAGDDYESGDSRDESEIRYERNHEIVEKGETLGSDDEYEDDDPEDEDDDLYSFIVSSEQEDNDLLSGTDDDLSMSDNELTMSAKSKKKFNDQLKEQKKASKEMYEARHNKKASLSNSVDIDTSKPFRVDLDDDDDDSVMQPTKKKNRMRLDSSHETSISKPDADVSTSKKINKSGLKLNTTCNNTVINEHEITAVVDESIIQKTDPLKTAIKTETMTPQKGLDISTVNISVRQDVEEVQINEDASMMKPNETSDPLQLSMKFDDDEESSSSGNQEIIQNYDSMLSQLNKSNDKKKIKDHDISLNKNNNTKKVKHAVFDQLNLTNTKEQKKRKTSITDKSENKNKSSNRMEVDLTDNSDSVAAKDDNKNKQVKSSLSPNKKSKIQEKKPIVDQINLTNTRETQAKSSRNQNKSNKSSIQIKADDTSSDSLELKLLFSDDGSDSSEDQTMKKHNESSQTNTDDYNHQKHNDCQTDLQKTKENQDYNMPLTKTPGSTKKKDKRLSTTLNEDQSEDVISQMIEPSLKKKNKRVSESSAFTESEQTDDASVATKSPRSSKKKRLTKSMNFDETEVVIATENNETAVNASLDSSEKKNRKESFSVTDSHETETKNNELNVSCKKKNKSFTVVDSTEIDHEVSLNSTKKKKRKDSFVVTDSTEADITENEGSESVNSDKKKNRKARELIIVAESTDNQHDVSLNSTKKKKKKDSFAVTDSTEADITENEGSASVNSDKKKNKKPRESFTAADSTETEITENDMNPCVGKNKNKKSLEPVTENVAAISVISNKKKHKKESLSTVDSTEIDVDAANKSLDKSETITKKRNKLSKSQILADTEIKLAMEKTKRALIDSLVRSTKPTESVDEAPEEIFSKKRKRTSAEILEDGASASQDNSLLIAGNQQKKFKQNTGVDDGAKTELKPKSPIEVEEFSDGVAGNKKKRNKKSKLSNEALPLDNGSAGTSQTESNAVTSQDGDKKSKKTLAENQDQESAKKIPDTKINKKRKRDGDEGSNKQTKVLKENFFDDIHISRLPKALLEQLENSKPKQPKNKNIVSTSAFVVEESVKRRNKPSNYLEDSISINSGSPEKKRRNKMEKPKVLPFVPTASTTSGCGFTTNFQVRVCPKEVKFVAQSTDTVNFKNDYIQKQKLKKLGTYETYKNQRKVKLSKF